ncbi:hypothetical protein DSM02_1978 [Leeuwenhoekiella polynyae]|uniref:Peptidase M48-like protein n=1 Tax=Leeuwenhoekiella polynyae TaxID=1550906 RepID=A0A4Q0P550_9FLAO|nr:hypothetical protein [Leeuwenhoekiella polynyae]RXG21733.1 hypothetical protein DSM02_1978 [Leeuwenhoekiella polynyae]
MFSFIQKSLNFYLKEEQLIDLYIHEVTPLFEVYPDLNIPDELHIDEADHSVDAGAAFGYVEVSMGLVELEDPPIQIFVLAHELSHIATLTQAAAFNLGGEIPAGSETNDYKKAEYLADLMAFYLISKNEPETYDLLKEKLDYLEELLGNGDFTHPSGSSRIESLMKYLKGMDNTSKETAFSNRFRTIWSMN